MQLTSNRRWLAAGAIAVAAAVVAAGIWLGRHDGPVCAEPADARKGSPLRLLHGLDPVAVVNGRVGRRRAAGRAGQERDEQEPRNRVPKQVLEQGTQVRGKHSGKVTADRPAGD